MMKKYAVLWLLFAVFLPGVIHPQDAQRKIILVDVPANVSISAFQRYCQKFVFLNQFGDVYINVSILPEKARFRITDPGDPYLQYAIHSPTFFSFYPPDEVAGVNPPDFVKKNQEALRQRSAVLESLGLNGYFMGFEPFFLPESFYAKHPELRGPRCDHPRRSRNALFSPCVDHPEVLRLYEESAAALLRNAPAIRLFRFTSNDCACGYCWADQLYVGKNGPAFCRNRTAGDRLHGFWAALRRGAKHAGSKDIAIVLYPKFNPDEIATIQAAVPPNTHVIYKGIFQYHSQADLHAGGSIMETYPVRGILNPLNTLEMLDRWNDPDIRVVSMNFLAYYDRLSDSDPVIDRTLAIIEEVLAHPATENNAEIDRQRTQIAAWTDEAKAAGIGQTLKEIERLTRLRRLCAGWVGEDQADTLCRAFYLVQQALDRKSRGGFLGNQMYGGVSTRWITRPLVVKPELLTEDERSYWLPHVFDPVREDANNDYLLVHGGRRLPDSDKPFEESIALLHQAADMCDAAGKQPATSWLRDMAAGCRIYASILRTAGNFAAVQMIRDRRAADLAEPLDRATELPRRRFSGDEDLLRLNATIRDEIDNVQALIIMLKNSGTGILGIADKPEDEDTFLLGADIIEQLNRKVSIMLKYWRTAETYFPSPHK